MATYRIWSGGNNTDPSDSTWANAAYSFKSLYDAGIGTSGARLGSGDIVLVASDSAEVTSYGGHFVFYGPTSGLATVISVDRNDDTYLVATSSTQVNPTTTYNFTFNGNFEVYGLAFTTNGLFPSPTAQETSYFEDVKVALAANSTQHLIGASINYVRWKNLTMDLTADSSTPRSGQVLQANYTGKIEIDGLSFYGTTGNQRSGCIFQSASTSNPVVTVTNADFSNFTYSGVDICDDACHGQWTFFNCKTIASPNYVDAGTGTYPQDRIEFYNCASSDSPWHLFVRDSSSYLYSTTSVTRSGGASVEGTAYSWHLQTTPSDITEAKNFKTNWVYGVVSSTGSKTFSIYFKHDATPAADCTNAQVWIEVDLMGTSNVSYGSMISSHRVITATASSTGMDDTAGLWSTAGTYEQVASVTGTVGEEGLVRARLVIAVPSIVTGNNWFIDPKVHVS